MMLSDAPSQLGMPGRVLIMLIIAVVCVSFMHLTWSRFLRRPGAGRYPFWRHSFRVTGAVHIASAGLIAVIVMIAQTGQWLDSVSNLVESAIFTLAACAIVLSLLYGGRLYVWFWFRRAFRGTKYAARRLHMDLQDLETHRWRDGIVAVAVICGAIMVASGLLMSMPIMMRHFVSGG